MEEEHLRTEIEATKESLKKLRDIYSNTLKGIEINEFVLVKLEDEYLRDYGEYPEPKKKTAPLGVD